MELDKADVERWRAVAPREMTHRTKSTLLEFLIWYINEFAEPKEARRLRGEARRLRKAELVEIVVDIVDPLRAAALGGRRAAVAHTKRKREERTLKDHAERASLSCTQRTEAS